MDNEQQIDTANNVSETVGQTIITKENEAPTTDPSIEKAKNRVSILVRICFVFSLICAFLFGPGLIVSIFVLQPFSWIAAYLPQTAPFAIILTLTILLSLISLIAAIRVTNKTDDPSFKTETLSRSLFSTLFLLLPAMQCSTFRIPGLSILLVSIVETILVIIFFVIRSLEKKNKLVIKGGMAIVIVAMILSVLELVFCGSWYHAVINNTIEEHKSEKQEEAERNEALQALRNASIENELSDIVATHCSLEPYEIIYNDNKTEGIFKCKDENTLFYASYFGKNESNKIQMSIFDLATIYDEENYIRAYTIGENGKTTTIFFIDAENETLAYEKAKTLVVKTASNHSFNNRRIYAIYAKGYKTFTDKDYLNAIFASGVYIPKDDYDCGTLFYEYEDNYECVEMKDDMFRRYIGDKNNYSSYSIDALFKNRHLFMVTYNDSSEAAAKEMFADATWNRPFTQGELAFKYIPSKDYSPNDLDIVDDGSDDDEDNDDEDDADEDDADDEDWEDE